MTSKPGTVHLLLVTELSFVKLLWMRSAGRTVFVLDVVPLLPFLAPILERAVRFVDRLTARRADADELARFRELRRTTPNWRVTDVLLRSEKWFDTYYGFARHDGDGYRYAYPYKHVTIVQLQWYLQHFFFLRAYARSAGDRRIIVHGVSPEFVKFLEASYGCPTSIEWRYGADLRAIVNPVLALAVLVTSAARIVRWLSLSKPRPKPVLLGFDAIANTEYRTLITELTDRPEDTLAVFRNREHEQIGVEWFKPLPACPLHDGALGPADALRAVAHCVTALIGIWKRFRNLHPRHFFLVAKFPLVEITYGALFRKYRFSYFFGRDDYNVEHIFRTWELRKSGGKSIGLNHGTPYYPIIDPCWRYLDYDTYYVFGTDIFRRHYVDRWPEAMTVRAVGSFGMTKRRAAELAEGPRSRDIAVLVKLFDGVGENADVVGIVRALADAFPDRRIIVKPKIQRVRGVSASGRRQLNMIDRPNVEVTEENTYDVLCRAGYAVSTPSTVFIETIQFGCISFCQDAVPDSTPLQFREYPEICHRDVGEIIARIRLIESGDWSYPWDEVGGLICLSKEEVSDVIRRDLGLPSGTRHHQPDAATANAGASQPA